MKIQCPHCFELIIIDPSIAAKVLGRAGNKNKTRKQRNASRKNGTKGGRRRKGYLEEL